MRALLPDRIGTVDRDGVDIGFEVYGRDADPTLVFVPPAPITHSRMFKAQVPYLADGIGS